MKREKGIRSGCACPVDQRSVGNHLEYVFFKLFLLFYECLFVRRYRPHLLHLPPQKYHPRGGKQSRDCKHAARIHDHREVLDVGHGQLQDVPTDERPRNQRQTGEPIHNPQHSRNLSRTYMQAITQKPQRCQLEVRC